MKTYAVCTLDQEMTEISEEEIRELSAKLHGELLTPESPQYDEARAIWNSMVDRRPGLIVRCSGSADVLQAVIFARNHDLLLSIRGGGHNIAGSAVCDHGLMLDLSQMRSVQIDPEARIALVEPGCTLADFDREAQAFGLATPVGINSTTGVAGLTLGGGFGWLSRLYGMTVDNLLAVDIVTAEGELVQASEDRHQDLFWAVRGGGGNFGVVTSFKFRLHKVGPEVLSGLIVHPFSEAKKVLQFYREFVAGLPDETAVWAVVRKAPPLPFLPEEWHGKEVVVLAAFHAGDMAEGERLLEPLRSWGKPIADVIGPHQYVQWQQAFDPLLTPGARNYWKSHNFEALSDEALDTLVDYAGRLPSPHTEIFIGQVGGQMGRVGETETAYPHRDAEFVMNVHARWENSSEDEECIQWARAFFHASAPYATGGVYINFLTQEETDRIRNAYGPNYDRLVEVKTKYDPHNLFRFNQNIKPAEVA
ncbi:FAD/FMN-containing dehydrogenase [Pontibacter ummariensis]|uniref:FAD/FMN-containing dehydrogenase n=1 Tax=Pontibacter ummariensis TaxID=1610492 RepID=A0A239F4L7_9BACT|nr:FAD-binding oxidoreductase [Pontibacter ummariensis]PRY12430.1 FAD/FMN-containing dehydrogenase [Pontibacter ummariensis]SNS51856.1 FAD/FMN-containing dehydrogenase [Pontibacter ummariensis]